MACLPQGPGCCPLLRASQSSLMATGVGSHSRGCRAPSLAPVPDRTTVLPRHHAGSCRTPSASDVCAWLRGGCKMSPEVQGRSVDSTQESGPRHLGSFRSLERSWRSREWVGQKSDPRAGSRGLPLCARSARACHPKTLRMRLLALHSAFACPCCVNWDEPLSH